MLSYFADGQEDQTKLNTLNAIEQYIHTLQEVKKKTENKLELHKSQLKQEAENCESPLENDISKLLEIKMNEKIEALKKEFNELNSTKAALELKAKEKITSLKETAENLCKTITQLKTQQLDLTKENENTSHQLRGLRNEIFVENYVLRDLKSDIENDKKEKASLIEQKENLVKELKDLESKKDRLTIQMINQLEDETTKIINLTKERVQHEEEFKRENDSRIQKKARIDKTIAELRKVEGELVTEIEKYKNEIHMIQQEHELLKQAKAHETTNKYAMDNEIKTLTLEIQGYQTQRDEQANLLNELTEKVQQFQTEIIDLEKQKNQLAQDVEDSQNTLSNLLEEIKSKLEEKERITRDINHISEVRRKEREGSVLEESLQETIRRVQEEKAKLLTKVDYLQTQNAKAEDEIEKMKQNLAEFYQKRSFLKSSNKELLEENKKLNAKLFDLKTEHNSLKIQKEWLNGKTNGFSTQVIDPGHDTNRQISKKCSTSHGHPASQPLTDLPSVSVKCDSLFVLAKKGWPVLTNHHEQIIQHQGTLLPLVSIIGSSGSGKSTLAKLLSYNQISPGLDNNRSSIKMTLISDRKGLFRILESSGWNEPVHTNDKGIIETIPGLGPQESIRQNHLSLINKRYQTLFDDSKIIEDLKLRFMIKYGNFILFIIGKLTETEVEKLYEVRQLMAENESATNTSKIALQAKQLIIIHNMWWIHRKEEVIDQIKDNLMLTYNLMPEPLFNDKHEELMNEDCNKYLWKDEFGYTHLILAAENSEAGRYYNRAAITFLLSKVKVSELKEPLNFYERFAEFCSKQLQQLVSTDIELQYDLDSSRIVTTKKMKLEPSHLFYPDSLNIFMYQGFVPCYSKKIWNVDKDKIRVELEIEVPDCEPIQPTFSWSKGKLYFNLRGTKRSVLEVDETGESRGKIDFVNKGRYEGFFVSKIPVIRGEWENKKIIEEDYKDGVAKIIVEFTKKPTEITV